MFSLGQLVAHYLNTSGSNNPEFDARLEHKRKLQREWHQRRKLEMSEEEKQAAKDKRNAYYRDYMKRKKQRQGEQ